MLCDLYCFREIKLLGFGHIAHPYLRPFIKQVVWRMDGHGAVHLPALSSFLQLFSSDPLLQVLEFPGGLRLDAKLAFILWRAYNITEEQGNIEPSRFCEVHQVYDHT